VIVLKTKRAREILTADIIKQIVLRRFRNTPAMRAAMDLKGWTEDDVIQEMFLHIITSPHSSPTKIRERWIDKPWSYYDLNEQKPFRGWLRNETRFFILNAGKEERRRRAEYWIMNSDTKLFEIADTKNMEEDVLNSLMIERLGEWVERECDLKEQFIFLSRLGLVEMNWNGTETLSNYPGGPVSRKTFYNHKKSFNERMRNYLKETNK
tara:strand:+ start:5126 stop:5752 length:627 start_codon:yes stop_codon:yes gene_type:complete